MLELAKSGAFSKGVAGLTFTEGAAEFAQGTAAMTIAGTWGLATFEGDSVVVDGKVKIIPFPRSEDPQVTETVLQAVRMNILRSTRIARTHRRRLSLPYS